MVALLLAALALAPGHFGARIDNPYLPFAPGTTWRYRGVESGRRSLDVVTVTRRTMRIAGARCVVVHDRLYLAGRLAERTTDWYSQDRAGNVWYFGESTAELDARGRVTSTEGSWRAGRRGARAGIVMPAHPRAGDTFAQERFPGHAEDRFRVLGRVKVTVPHGLYRHALRTREWTPLEPGVVDHKFYVRGLGMVAERSARGPHEHAELIAVTHSP
jgi:hypothetical protein